MQPGGDVVRFDRGEPGKPPSPLRVPSSRRSGVRPKLFLQPQGGKAFEYRVAPAPGFLPIPVRRRRYLGEFGSQEVDRRSQKPFGSVSPRVRRSPLDDLVVKRNKTRNSSPSRSKRSCPPSTARKTSPSTNLWPRSSSSTLAGATPTTRSNSTPR